MMGGMHKTRARYRMDQRTVRAYTAWEVKTTKQLKEWGYRYGTQRDVPVKHPQIEQLNVDIEVYVSLPGFLNVIVRVLGPSHFRSRTRENKVKLKRGLLEEAGFKVFDVIVHLVKKKAEWEKRMAELRHVLEGGEDLEVEEY